MRDSIRVATFAFLWLLVALRPGYAVGQEHPGDIHTFTGANGNTVEAEVLDLVNGMVVIRRLSDGQRFELPANRLAQQDVDFMRAWLAAREAAKHPLGWKKLRVHLPEAADTVEAPGIPAAFRQTGRYTFEAELPEGAWVLVKLWREGGGEHAPQFLLPYDGEQDWFFSFQNSRLEVAPDPAAPVRKVGIAIQAEDDEAALRSMKSEFPAEGIALYAGYIDAADVSALRGAKLTSLVVGKLPEYSIVKDANVRALRVTDTVVDTGGLATCESLEFFEVPYSGEFPLSTLGDLPKLHTLIADGDVDLESTDSEFASLRHLSLADAEIEGAAAMTAFLGKAAGLRSLILPDFQEIDVTGIAQCTELSALSLGNECLDHGAKGASALDSLTVALLNPHYTSEEISLLAREGRFAKVRTLGVSQVFDFSQAPLLRELHLAGDQAGFPLGQLSQLPKLPSLVLNFASDADLSALGEAGPNMLGLKSLTLQSPNVFDLSPLAGLPALERLSVRDQLVTFEQKLEEIDLSGCSRLRKLELTRLQNTTHVSTGTLSLSAMIFRSCSELIQVEADPGDSLTELVIDNCRNLKPAASLVGSPNLQVKRIDSR